MPPTLPPKGSKFPTHKYTGISSADGDQIEDEEVSLENSSPRSSSETILSTSPDKVYKSPIGSHSFPDETVNRCILDSRLANYP